MYDVLFRNGTVIDGTRRPGFAADVAVKDGFIVEIGYIPAEAQSARVVDATGQVVCPGFIDIHTHADIALLARPEHLPKVMQGVTTEVFTNCGLGFAPVSSAEALAVQKEYVGGLFGDDGSSTLPANSRRVDWAWRSVADLLDRYETGGVATNVAYLIPHGSVRVSVMGMAERSATSDEVSAMCALVEQGMEQGAWGLSTGIWYAPMRSADRAELVTLCRAAGLFATHQRDYGSRIFDATEETLAIAKEGGVPVQISHLQMNGPGNQGRAGDLLAVIDRARTAGVDATCDTYPYTAGSTFIQSLLPAWAVDGGPEAILRRLADPELCQRAAQDVEASRDDWNTYQLVGASSRENREFEGERFEVIAAARGMRVGEWVCAVLLEDELRACYVHHAAHEDNVRSILQWEGQMVGSDGLHLPGKTHPRLYGTFPRVLGHYARDTGTVGLEAAVHKMTGAPAARLGLPHRGTLATGHAADIVVFDPATVGDIATFEDPLRYPSGIQYVFVNGRCVKDDGQHTGALAGQILRKQT